MPLIYTEDREYLFAIDDHADTRNGRPQWVVYRGDQVVIDRHSWEAAHGTDSPLDPVRPPPDPDPVPRPDPSPVPVGPSRVIRVSDGPFAPRMMSDRANAWVSGHHAYVFAGSRATGWPQFFEVDLHTDHVVALPIGLPYRGETEGWLWLPDGTLIAIDGPLLIRVHPLTGTEQIVLDISGTHPGCDLWQPHASDDGQTYSATVRRIVSSGAYPKIGTVTVHHGRVDYWQAVGVLDESQVRRDGRGVLIKENGDDNRYIDLDTGEITWLSDHNRAVGHSDMGPNYVVGEADKPDPGGCVIWHLDRLNEGPRFLFATLNLGYVSCRGGRCLHSDDTHLRLIDLQTGAATVLRAHGGGSTYDNRVKASLDPSGQVATYMVEGSVYLLVL